MKIKYLEFLAKNTNVFSVMHEPLKGCSQVQLEKLVRFFNCNVPVCYLELMYLGGYNFFGLVNAPNYGFGYDKIKLMQEQLKGLLVKVNRYTGREIALCCLDDLFWFIYCDDVNDPPIRYYSEESDNIEIEYSKFSEMVEDMILQYKNFYNL